MRILLLLLVAVSFMIAGCSSSNEPSVMELFPLKVGNTWTFNFTDEDNVTTEVVNTVKNEITILQNEKWFVLDYDNELQSVCKNKSDGFWFADYNTESKIYTPELVYKYPASTGNQYETNSGIKVKVVSINEKITVPFGTFDCYHYEIDYGDDMVTDEYFAPNVGLIKLVSYAVEAGQKIKKSTTELKSFVFKKNE